MRMSTSAKSVPHCIARGIALGVAIVIALLVIAWFGGGA
jgi:hypothetical protein